MATGIYRGVVRGGVVMLGGCLPVKTRPCFSATAARGENIGAAGSSARYSASSDCPLGRWQWSATARSYTQSRNARTSLRWIASIGTPPPHCSHLLTVEWYSLRVPRDRVLAPHILFHRGVEVRRHRSAPEPRVVVPMNLPVGRGVAFGVMRPPPPVEDGKEIDTFRTIPIACRRLNGLHRHTG